jgi:hypothetical protein
MSDATINNCAVYVINCSNSNYTAECIINIVSYNSKNNITYQHIIKKLQDNEYLNYYKLQDFDEITNKIELKSRYANINTFINENPSVPKVLLFTDKPKGTPMVYKGLSVAFEKKLNFGLVRSNDSILVSKYNVKKFPTVIVVKANEKKPIFYDGK